MKYLAWRRGSLVASFHEGLRRRTRHTGHLTYIFPREGDPARQEFKCHDPKTSCCLLVGASSVSWGPSSLLKVSVVSLVSAGPLLPPGVLGKVVRGGGWLPFWVRWPYFSQEEETDAWRLMDLLSHSWTAKAGVLARFNFDLKKAALGS